MAIGRKKRNIAAALTAVFAALALALILYDTLTVPESGERPLTLTLWLSSAERLLLFGAFVCVVCALGQARFLTPRFKGALLACIASLAVALANFPFFTLASGELEYTASAPETLLYLLLCLSIGLFEEIAFRAFLIPLISEIFKKNKYAPLIAVVLSSGIFSLAHLLNLLGGASLGATLLQVGYTFLTGCMFGALFILTRSVFAPVIVHTLYDVGGLLTSSGMASGSQWNAPSIAVMAVVSVLAGAYLVFTVLRRAVIAKNLPPLFPDCENKTDEKTDDKDKTDTAL